VDSLAVFVQIEPVPLVTRSEPSGTSQLQSLFRRVDFLSPRIAGFGIVGRGDVHSFILKYFTTLLRFSLVLSFAAPSHIRPRAQ
jgi:hypothetical protein